MSEFLKNITDWFIVNTSLTALIISFISIIFVFISLLLQRKFIKKSFTPIPYFELGDYENDLFVKLCNYGTGPFIIKKFKAYNLGSTKESLIQLMPNHPEISWCTFFEEFENVPIAPNKFINILELKIDNTNPTQVKFRDEVRETLRTTRISLDYSDIFKKKWPTYTKNLKWFGRNI